MYDGYVKYFKVTGDKTCVPNVFNFYLRRPRRVAISLIRNMGENIGNDHTQEDGDNFYHTFAPDIADNYH